MPSLHALLQNGVEICAIVIPAAPKPGSDQLPILRKDRPRLERSALPMLNSSLQNNIVQLAWQHQLPVWEVARLSDPSVVTTLASYQPDIICVACFSLRIPRIVLDIPCLGCLNVHPSLLPANRGPEPLFWAFRQGLQKTGVSIHFMNEGMDTGDILAQDSIDIPAGISYAELEQQCAIRGAELLLWSVQALYEGRAIRTPQGEERSSYQSFPGSKDFIVPVAEWSAEHVYTFICGIAGWGESIKLLLDTEYVHIQQAISYSQEDIGISPGKVYSKEGGILQIQCKKGWVAVVSPTASQ